MFGWQSNLGSAGKRLFQPDRQPILITAGDERRPRSAANCRVRVSLQEAHALRRNGINIRSAKIGASVTGDVGVSQIIGKNEDNIRCLCCLIRAHAEIRVQSNSGGKCAAKKISSRTLDCPNAHKGFSQRKVRAFYPKGPGNNTAVRKGSAKFNLRSLKQSRRLSVLLM